jgi:predicted RNA binding protein YcfA (HicA-like mRNA interferase family)
MANVRKLIEKLLSRPTEMRSDEVVTILRHYGYEQRKSSGGTSHRKFVKPGMPPVVFPEHDGKVWRVYLKEIIVMLNIAKTGK